MVKCNGALENLGLTGPCSSKHQNHSVLYQGTLTFMGYLSPKVINNW